MIKKNGFDYIFAGMIFILINIPINGVDIAPDFIGYALLIAGYSLLKNENVYFMNARKYALVLLFISAALFYRSIVLIGEQDIPPRIAEELMLALITIIFVLLNYANLFRGIKEFAIRIGNPETAAEAMKSWKGVVILNMLAFLLIPLAYVPAVFLIFLVILAIYSIMLVIRILKLMKKCSALYIL